MGYIRSEIAGHIGAQLGEVLHYRECKVQLTCPHPIAAFAADSAARLPVASTMDVGSSPQTHVVAADRGEGQFALAGGDALLAVCPNSHEWGNPSFKSIKPGSHGDRHSNGGANLPGRAVRMLVRIGDEAL